MLATVISLFVFVMMANVLMLLYARGVVRAAVDEGARAGAVAYSSDTECLDRATAALDDLLAGSLGNDIAVTCTIDGADMVATATATLSSPFAGFAEWTFVAEARATDESSLLP